MYQKVSPDMNFVDREKNVGKFWRNQQIFEKSMKAREGKPVYTFYDGPPTANGKPHKIESKMFVNTITKCGMIL